MSTNSRQRPALAMRTLGYVVLASVAAGAVWTIWVLIYQLAFLDRAAPTLVRVLEMWLFGAIGACFVNTYVGLPIVALLKRLEILRWPVVVAAGAFVGLALCALLSMLPNFDPPATPPLSHQLQLWLSFGVIGALSAALLGHFLRPSSNSTVERDARNGGAPPP